MDFFSQNKKNEEKMPLFTNLIDLRINWKIWCKRIYLIIVDSIILYMQLPIWCVRSFLHLFVRSLGVIFFCEAYHKNDETEETTISDTKKEKEEPEEEEVEEEEGECQSSGIQQLNIEGKRMKIDW